MAENLRITITDKATHTQYMVMGPQIVLSGQSIVELPIPQTQIKSLARHGDALMVNAVDGQVIVIRGFFVGNIHSDLATLDGRHGESVITYIDWNSVGTQDGSAVVVPATQVASPVGLNHGYLFFDQGSITGTDAAVARVNAGDEVAPVGPSRTRATVIPTNGMGATDVTGTGFGAGNAVARRGGQPPRSMAGSGMVATVNGRRTHARASPPPPAAATVSTVTNTPNDTLAVARPVQPGNIRPPAPATPPASPKAPASGGATGTPGGTITMTGGATAPTFSGALARAPASGGMVQISFDGGKTWNPVTNITGAHWTYDGAAHPFTSGAYNVVVRTTDSNGATLDSWGQTFIIETRAPTATVSITFISAHFITATLSAARAIPGLNDIVQISADGGQTWHEAIPDTGEAFRRSGSPITWSYAPPAPLTNGSYLIKARAMDMAGNVGQATSQHANITDGLPPAPTQTATLVAISPNTGVNSGDFITNTGAITLAGSYSAALASGQIVQVSLNGSTWQDAIIGARSLTWRYSVSGLANGNYTVQTRVYDTTSRQAGAVTDSARPLVIDSTAPTKTVSIAATSADGLTFSGALSNALDQNGSAPEILQISLDGGSTWQTVSDVNGTRWNHTSSTALSAGSHTVGARVITLAGNSGAVATETVTVTNSGSTGADTDATPTLADTDTGASRAHFMASATDITLTGAFSAALAAGQEVQISLNGAPWQAAAMDADGLTWRYAASGLTDDGCTVETRVHDTGVRPADTVTSNTPPEAIDAAASAEVVTIVAISADGLTFSGTLGQALRQNDRATETLQISTDGGETWQTVPSGDIDGTRWSHISGGAALDTGHHSVAARIIDLAGNASAATTTTVTVGDGVDSDAAPTPTTTTSFATIDPDTGANSSDAITCTGTITLWGTISGGGALPAHKTVQISLDGGQRWDAAAVGTGGLTWRYTASGLLDRSHTLAVQTRVYDTMDKQGNIPSSNQSPGGDGAAPTGTATRARHPSPSAKFSSSEKMRQISIDGRGTRQTVSADNINTGWADTNAMTSRAGNHAMAAAAARVIDFAGNPGQGATEMGFVTDGSASSAAPTQTATLTAISPDNGSSGTDFITDVSNITLSGTLSTPLTEGQEVQINLNGIWETIPESNVTNTTWSYQANDLVDASYTVRLRVVDSETNLAGPVTTGEQLVVVDTTPPGQTIVISDASSDGRTISGTLSEALNPGGNGASAEQLELSFDEGGSWIPVPAEDIIGTSWFYISGSPLGVGSRTVLARIVDAAGNEGKPVAQVVDMGAPGAPEPTVARTNISPRNAPGHTDFVTDTVDIMFRDDLGAAPQDQDVQELHVLPPDGGGDDHGMSVDPASATDAHWNHHEANSLGEISPLAAMHRHDGSTSVDDTVSSQPVGMDTTAPATTVIAPSTLNAINDEAVSLAGATADTDPATDTLDSSDTPDQSLATSSITPPDGSDDDHGISVDPASATDASWSRHEADSLGKVSPLAAMRLHGAGAGVDDTESSQPVGMDTTAPTTTATVIAPSTLNAINDEAVSLAGATDTATDALDSSDALDQSLVASIDSGSVEPAQASLDDGNRWQTATANDATWAFESTDDSLTDTDGPPATEVRAIDMASNVGAEAAQAVAAETTVTIAATSADGLTVSGTLGNVLNQSPGFVEQLQVSIDDATWQTVPSCDITGNRWSYIGGHALDTGRHHVKARVVDTSGNVVGQVATATVTVADARDGDVTVPATTARTSVTPGSRTAGSVGANTRTGLTFTGTLGMTLSSDQAVQISLDGGKSWGAASITGSTWTYTYSGPALENGNHLVKVEVISGNLTRAIASQALIIDGSAPTEQIRNLAVSSDGLTISGTLSNALDNADGIITKILAVGIDGQWLAVPDANIDDGSGEWSLTLSTPIANGATVVAEVLDSAGNEGPQAMLTASGIGDAEPQPITIAAISPSGAAFVTNASTGITITGTLGAPLGSGETLHISLDDGQNWAAIPAADITTTEWTYTHSSTALAEGSHWAVVAIIDDGQTSAVASQALVVDTIAPTEQIHHLAVSIDGLTISGILSGALNGAGGTPEILAVGIDGSLQAVPAANIHGTDWRLALTTPVANGSVVMAAVVDQAGNAGPIASLQVGGGGDGVDVDGDVAQPAMTTPEAAASAADGATSASSPSPSHVLSGTLDQALPTGGKILVSLDGGNSWYPATADAGSMRWSLTSSDWSIMPANGAETCRVELVVVNSANQAVSRVMTQQAVFGSHPLTGGTATLTLVTPDTAWDSTLPGETVAACVSAADGSHSFTSTENTGLTFTGTASSGNGDSALPGDYAQISLDGGKTWENAAALGAAPNGGSIYWSYTDPNTLANGTYTVQVKYVSAAGITGAPVTAGMVVIDAQTPSKMTPIATAAGDAVTHDGFSASHGLLALNGSISARLDTGANDSTWDANAQNALAPDASARTMA